MPRWGEVASRKHHGRRGFHEEDKEVHRGDQGHHVFGGLHLTMVGREVHRDDPLQISFLPNAILKQLSTIDEGE